MTEAEIRHQLRNWIIGRAKEKPAELTDETPVLASGILSSLDVVELILFVEQLRGDEVSLETLEPESIRNVNAIYQTFFQH